MLANNLFKLNTKILISSDRFNMNNLTFIKDKESKVADSNVIQNTIKIKSIIPKEFRFSIIKIPRYTVVFLIENEASFFSMNAYTDLLVNSNIKLLLSCSNRFYKIITKFYKNIYNSDEIYDHIIFTNKLFKTIPLNSVDINKSYVFKNDYNLKNRFNCFYVNDKKDIVNIDIDEYEYQKFTTSSINWFISKIFNNKLHVYNPANIIICTHNLQHLDGIQYIFLGENMISFFRLYYNWFNFSHSNYNLQLSEFILLTIGYYFSKITTYSNIFIDSYIANKTDDTIGLKKNNLLKGIQLRNEYLGDFFDYIKLIQNKFGDVSPNIDRKTNINNIALIKDYNKEIVINDILVKKLEFPITNIETIRMSFSCKNIWIFDTFEDLNLVCNELWRFPDENLKINMAHREFYKISNNYESNIYKNILLDEYVLDFNKMRNQSISILIQKIEPYRDKIIITVLLDIQNNYKYFSHYYNNKGYKIIFINLFNINTKDVEINSNNIIINYSDNIVKSRNLIFIKPNFYYDLNNTLNNNYKMFSCRYFKDIDKSTKYSGMYKYVEKTDKFYKLYVLNLEISILCRIKLNKFYNIILNNVYSGLYDY